MASRHSRLIKSNPSYTSSSFNMGIVQSVKPLNLLSDQLKNWRNAQKGTAINLKEEEE